MSLDFRNWHVFGQKFANFLLETETDVPDLPQSFVDFLRDHVSTFSHSIWFTNKCSSEFYDSLKTMLGDLSKTNISSLFYNSLIMARGFANLMWHLSPETGWRFVLRNTSDGRIVWNFRIPCCFWGQCVYNLEEQFSEGCRVNVLR